jgi:hypothetical protein
MAHEDIALPAQRVWDVIGDFGGIRKWATAVQDERLESGGDVPVRVLTMGNGNTVRESMIAGSQFSYTYTLLDQPTPSDYRGTVAVIPLDPQHSRIVLITHVSATGEVTEEDLTARYTAFVTGNMKAMKRALGVE